jgi:hypothetical protein
VKRLKIINSINCLQSGTLGFWAIIVVIFSSKILFSLSISVYLSVMKMLVERKLVTFLNLIFFGFRFEVRVFCGTFDLLHGWFHLLKSLSVWHKLLILPPAINQLVPYRLLSQHLFFRRYNILNCFYLIISSCMSALRGFGVLGFWGLGFRV